MSSSTSASTRHAEAKTRIYWDLKYFPIPEHLGPEDIYRDIELALAGKGFQGHVSVRLYGDKNTLPPNWNEKDVIESYDDAGIKLNLVPEVEGVDYKRVRDAKMTLDMLAIGLENPRPQGLNLMVVATVEEELAVDHISAMHNAGDKVFFVHQPTEHPVQLLISKSAPWLSEIFPGSTQHVDNNHKSALHKKKKKRQTRQKRLNKADNFA